VCVCVCGEFLDQGRVCDALQQWNVERQRSGSCAQYSPGAKFREFLRNVCVNVCVLCM